MSENKADPLRDILRCIETIEGAYNFECEAGPLKNCGEWKYLKRLCGVGATPQPPAPDHLPLPFESAGMRGARKQAERDHASMFPQPAAPLVRDLCGDDLNGGLIRDLCFTVWKIFHEPKHSDGNSDWGSDTLPVVQEAVRAIREKLDAALSADIIPQPAAPLGGREVADIRFAINVLLEKIAKNFDDWETMDIWRSEASQIVRSFKHNLSAAIPQERGAVADIVAERDRQISQEGWSREHDDAHIEREMAIAASCYASAPSMIRIEREWVKPDMPKEWPWKHSWWKPGTMRKNLIKAGALIVAEIERLDRAALQKDNP